VSVCKIIDTFPAFLEWWEKGRRLPFEEQLNGWEKDYMAGWPELRQKQLDSYAEDKADWRQAAGERVLPYLSERVPAMQEAHQNLQTSCLPVYEKAKKTLVFDFPLITVFYVGIGVGAGWATTYQNTPAVLCGLENIAECGWSGGEAIKGLLAHELGHLIQYHWRGQTKVFAAANPWRRLLEEGFAQRCEVLITGRLFHQTAGVNTGDWLEWCQNHKSWLAAEFLKTVEAGKSTAAFFGSWIKIQGKSETGYFLGHEVVKELEKNLSLKEIALLDDYEVSLKPILEGLK
jgi:hypothetical protein